MRPYFLVVVALVVDVAVVVKMGLSHLLRSLASSRDSTPRVVVVTARLVRGGWVERGRLCPKLYRRGCEITDPNS